jgi:hypothetical protein
VINSLSRCGFGNFGNSAVRRITEFASQHSLLCIALFLWHRRISKLSGRIRQLEDALAALHAKHSTEVHMLIQTHDTPSSFKLQVHTAHYQPQTLFCTYLVYITTLGNSVIRRIDELPKFPDPDPRCPRDDSEEVKLKNSDGSDRRDCLYYFNSLATSIGNRRYPSWMPFSHLKTCKTVQPEHESKICSSY